jgi:CHAT domain-containing protein
MTRVGPWVLLLLLQVLRPGESVERPLAAGDRHEFRVDVDAGHVVDILVDQRNIDVVIDVHDARGNRVAHAQDNIKTTGVERTTVTGDGSGAHLVTITAGAPRVARGTYTIRMTTPRPATDRDRDLCEAIRLRSEVAQLLEADNPNESVELATRALDLVKAGGAEDELVIAYTAKDLGDALLRRRSLKDAEAAFQQALGIFSRVLGPDDPATALTSSRLAVPYRRLGQRAAAEKLLRDAVQRLEAALGPEHPAVASALVTLGTVRQDAGDVEEGEALARRALAIVEKADGPAKLKADIFNNLGTLALDRRNYDEADKYLRAAAALGETLYGVESVWIADTLVNLGIVARQRKAYDEAERYYLRALEIRQRIVPPDHPDVASNLNNLANLYSSRGDAQRSLETHHRALAIWEKAAGPYGSGTLTSLGNIARVHAASGDIANAVSFQRRADAALEVQLSLTLATGSERQKLASARSMAERTDRTISLSLDLAAGNADASALAALVLLQRKGRVLDAVAATMAGLRERADAKDAQLLDQLSATTAALAKLALNGRQAMAADQYRAEIARLEQRKERIETEISEQNAQFRAQAVPVTLQRVQEAIPRDAALIEFAVFRPFNPKAATNSAAYAEPHYAAFVVKRQGTPRGVDLGPAAAIDAAVSAFRAALRDAKRTDVTKLARALDARVLAPLRPSAGAVSRLLVSPDGALNLIPFEALVDRQGRFAVERYAFSYLTSGRDLLRMAVERPSRGAPVIVADPTLGADFPPLTGTAIEAQAILAVFPRARLLSRERASKGELARVHAPEILHIASHGVFLQDAKIENPLLRSGVALAAVSSASQGADVLTALEAANLDLWGTKLVTLSACDTGIGTVRNGEGVYGLRRAFVIAGAETLVMSLWPVSDYVTRQMMSSYYRALQRGVGRGQALRQAQLALLADARRRHPFYWASFIQAGDWTPVKGS